MIREILIISLLMFSFFLSGCIKEEQTTKNIEVEEQAVELIENEMESAVENITIEEIENALTKE